MKDAIFIKINNLIELLNKIIKDLLKENIPLLFFNNKIYTLTRNVIRDCFAISDIGRKQYCFLIHDLIKDKIKVNSLFSFYNNQLHIFKLQIISIHNNESTVKHIIEIPILNKDIFINSLIEELEQENELVLNILVILEVVLKNIQYQIEEDWFNYMKKDSEFNKKLNAWINNDFSSVEFINPIVQKKIVDMQQELTNQKIKLENMQEELDFIKKQKYFTELANTQLKEELKNAWKSYNYLEHNSNPNDY